MITQAYLREILRYDSETGVFVWNAPRPKVQVGAIAGCLNEKGRRKICIDGRDYYAARLAWLYVHGRWPKEQIDHINCIRDDDRISNLRQATASQNQANRPITKMNRSGFKGVVHKPRLPKPWIAQICRGHIGCFNTPEEAHQAYVAEAKRIHGEYARAA